MLGYGIDSVWIKFFIKEDPQILVSVPTAAGHQPLVILALERMTAAPRALAACDPCSQRNVDSRCALVQKL